MSQASTFRPGKDFALFFANDDYAQNRDFENLKNPVKDAKAIAKLLESDFGFQTAVYANKTRKEIEQVLIQWCNKTYEEDAQLFLFFSGHGFWDEIYSSGYFVPKGLSQESNYLELFQLSKLIDRVPCKHILLAIDACYSGTIDQSIALKGSVNFQRPNQAHQERQNLIDRQLRFQSRLFISSGEKNRTKDGINHSPFTEGILRALRKSITDGRDLLYDQLLGELAYVSPKPHEGKFGRHEEGRFVFVLKDQSYSNSGRTSFSNSASSQMPIRTSTTPSNNSPKTVIDKHWNTYPFQPMKDGKTWLIKNLNVEVEDSYCYKNKSKNCQKYGRLYSWEAAKEACKQLGLGWRLPTDEEWRNMINQYGGEGKAAYQALIEGGSTGFSAQLGGNRYSSGIYNYSIGISGGYWSSTESSSSHAWSYYFSNGKLGRNDYNKKGGRSVRCLQD